VTVVSSRTYLAVKTTAIDYSRLEGTIYGSPVRSLKLIVVGAGALGNEVVKTLGLLGVAEVTIVDPDSVEPSNLTRSILFRTSDCVGRNKAEAIAGAARPIFFETRFSAISREIADVGLARLADANVIFSCVDSDLARLEIAYVSTKLDVPCCDAGLGAGNYSHGRVTWFSGKSGACFGCMLPAQSRRELLTIWEATRTPCFQFAVGDDSAGIPTTPTMTAIVASIQVHIGLKNYFVRTQASQTLEVDLDGLTRLERLSLKRSEACPFHWPDVHREQLIPMPAPKTRIGEWLSELDPNPGTEACLSLDWPICTEIECRDCELCWSPMLRAAVFARLVCPRCKSGNLIALECIRNVDQSCNWAGRHFADLCLPSDHLLTVRFIERQ